MEASAARTVGHDIGPASVPGDRSDMERKVIRVLENARVRKDRHMTKDRVCEYAGVYGRATGNIARALHSLCKDGLVGERVDESLGETTFVLRAVEEPRSDGLFARMLQGGVTPEAPKAATGRYKCPYCPDELKTENGRRIHIGWKHKDQPKLPKVARASCSTPGSAPVPTDEEEEEDDEEPQVLDGSGVGMIAAMHKRLMSEASKHGWTVEVLQASKKFAEVGEIRFLYNANSAKVAS